MLDAFSATRSNLNMLSNYFCKSFISLSEPRSSSICFCIRLVQTTKLLTYCLKISSTNCFIIFWYFSWISLNIFSIPVLLYLLEFMISKVSLYFSSLPLSLSRFNIIYGFFYSNKLNMTISKAWLLWDSYMHCTQTNLSHCLLLQYPNTG